jgi:DNA-binding NarL/FixJ family response regulator
VENGEDIAGLLAELSATGRHRDFIDRIREMYPPIAEKWHAIAAKLEGAGGKPSLTEREAAVAELVAAGLSDQAVGKTLHIAEVTAKKALHSAYRKLGVSNRAALTRVMLEQKAE